MGLLSYVDENFMMRMFHISSTICELFWVVVIVEVTVEVNR